MTVTRRGGIRVHTHKRPDGSPCRVSDLVIATTGAAHWSEPKPTMAEAERQAFECGYQPTIHGALTFIVAPRKTQ